MKQRIEILTELVRCWRDGQKNEHGLNPIDFYSGRIMIYKLMVALGFNSAEKLYKITPDNILGHSVADIVITLDGIEYEEETDSEGYPLLKVGDAVDFEMISRRTPFTIADLRLELSRIEFKIWQSHDGHQAKVIDADNPGAFVGIEFADGAVIYGIRPFHLAKNTNITFSKE